MKKYLYSLFVLCAWFDLSAQTQPQPSRWSIALTAGPAIPVGTFAGIHNDYANHKTVDIGGSAELSGAYRIWRFFSAAIAINGQYDHGNGIPANLGEGHLYKIGATPHSGAYAQDWQMARIVAGGLFTLPLNKHSGPALLLRVLAGVQRTRTPDFAYVDPTLDVARGYSNVLHLPGQNLAWAFSYQTDAGIKWSLGGRWALLAYAGYNGCMPSKSLVAEPDPGFPITLRYRKTTLPTGTIAIRAGAEFRL